MPLQARHLLVDALGAEERERQGLAEGLHDTALQNLLSARHDLQEVADTIDHPALERAESTISQTVGQLRDIVSELHPLVLEQAGLEAALSAVAAHASRRGGFHAHVAYSARPRPSAGAGAPCRGAGAPDQRGKARPCTQRGRALRPIATDGSC